MMQNNEIIRAKQKLYALVSDYKDLVLSVGCTLEILHVLAAILSAIVFKTLFGLIFIGGSIITFLELCFC